MTGPQEKSQTLDLSVIRAETDPSQSSADGTANSEVRDLEAQSRRIKVDREEEELKEYKEEAKARKWYAKWIFRLTVLWMTAVLAVLVFSGIEPPSHRMSVAGEPLPIDQWDWIAAFKLDNSVLIALIGGTTANVIGIFIIVANYLFPKRTKD